MPNLRITLGAISERRGFSGVAWVVISVVWFLAGLSAAVYHAVSAHDADATVLGFLVFAFAAFLIPIISNLELPGGTKIQFAAAAEVSANVTTLEQKSALAITDIAQMLRSLIGAQTRLASMFRLGAIDRATAYAIAIQTLIDAMSASKKWLVPQTSSDAAEPAADKAEPVRVTLWRWDDVRKQLVFLTGTVTAPQSVVLSSVGLTVTDDDYIGDAWRNARIANHAGAPDGWRALSQGNAPSGAAYPDPSPFGGVMFVPVLDDGKPVGMIQVDRANTIRFDANAEVVASALADLSSSVLGHPLVQWGKTT